MADPTTAAVVVVAEDGARRRQLADWLEAAGRPTLVVADGPSASAAAAQRDVGLLVIDRGAEGLDLLRRFRDGSTDGHVPVLLLSGPASPTERAARGEAFGLGAVDVCSRDVEATELLTRAGRLLALSDHRRGSATGRPASSPPTGSGLRQLEQFEQFEQLVELGSWHLDLTTGALSWSDTMRRLFGAGPDDEVDLPLFLSRIHPDDRAAVEAAWQRALEAGTTYALDHRLVVDGQVRWIRAQGRFEHDAQARAISASGVADDITERKHGEQQLAAERARLQDAFEAAEASTWEWDLTTDALHLDRRLEALDTTSVPDVGLTMTALLELVHPEDVTDTREAMVALLTGKHERYHAEFRLRRSMEGWIWLRAMGRIVSRELDATPTLIRGIVLDVTGLRAQQEQVAFAQTHDGLTGLSNRQRFTDTLRQLLAEEPDTPLAVISVDLDDFEAVNHAHGRAAGNLVLAELATRLLAVVDRRDHLARTGGDEFSLVLRAGEDELDRRAGELHELLNIPVPLRSGPTTLTASLGLTTSPQPGSTLDADQLLRQSDQAVYQAKLSGKSRTHRFDLAHHEHTRVRYALLEELARAITDGQLIAYYQPQVDLCTGRVLGVEALVRWQHPTRGLLPPGAFIPATQDHPIAIDLGTHVLDVALDQLVTWQAQGLTDLTIAVNTDPLQLEDPDFFERTLDQLRARPTVRRDQLSLEILETGAPEDLDAVAALIDRFQSTGITIALDDFGTGFASLTFLKRLGARLIKIDRSFTQGLLADPEDAMIVHAVTTLTRNLGRTAFAEGVETVDQGRLLVQLGCTQAQGYHIARPMPGDELPGWLETWQPPEAWAATRPLAPDELPALLAELRASAPTAE